MQNNFYEAICSVFKDMREDTSNKTGHVTWNTWYHELGEGKDYEHKYCLKTWLKDICPVKFPYAKEVTGYQYPKGSYKNPGCVWI